MQTVQAVLERVRATDWSVWDVPLGDVVWHCEPREVPAAFEGLLAVQDREGAQVAYNRLLDTLAHNHSGTPYPVMLPGVQVLAELLPLLHGWQLSTALEVLTECLLWSHDEGAFVTRDGRRYDLGQDTARHVHALRPTLERLARSGSDDEPVRPAASEVIRVLDDLYPSLQSPM